MIKALRAYEELERLALEHDGYWFDTIPDEIYNKIMECQELRNEVLGGNYEVS